MNWREMNSTTVRFAIYMIVLVLLATACASNDSGDDTAEDPTGDEVGADESNPTETGDDADTPATALDGDHGDLVATLTALLPSNTRQVFAADIASLIESDSAQEVAPLLVGESPKPPLVEPLAVIGALAESINAPAEIRTALVVYTSEAGSPALVASIRSTKLEDAVDGPMPSLDRTYGSSESELYVDSVGNQLTLLPGGVLVIGTSAAVESIVDVADGEGESEDSPVSPFLTELAGDTDIAFAYALPASFDDSLAGDPTLVGAEAVVGSLDIVEDSVAGSLAFHMANGAEFVDVFNTLNRASTEGGDEVPLVVAEPAVEGLEPVVATLPPLPFDASTEDDAASLAFFKKLFVGMDALDYASGVADRSNLAWLDFVVKSEADPIGPTSPGSVYIRWEFKDKAAVTAFEQNELPAGLRIAPTRFIESDNPDGEYFLALNLYDAAGGSIVGGARAEWDVFVHAPEGADPNAGVRPRFMVVDVLAEEVSADAGNLLTPAEPMSHELVDGTVVSSGARFDADGQAIPVFESSFPVPDPAVAEVARFTREMAIGNDYIYWAHAVSDRVLYNATTFNHDAYLVDVEQLSFSDDNRWSEYLKPDVKDAVYYVNNLEYVASPMANLDSEFLDISPEWLDSLVSFTTNGHQDGLMRSAVEQLFVGEGDPFVGVTFDNETPATYYHFEITNPDELEASLNLQPWLELAPVALFDGGESAHYLTLSVLQADASAAGMSARWSVYADDGSGRPPHIVVIDTMTEQVDLDPATILNLPSEVRHELEGGAITTRLSSPTVAFQASIDTADVSQEPLSLDWIEAGDRVCSHNGVCDLSYYDAETLDVPVDRAAEVIIAEFDTPWTPFVEASPSVVFFRDNSQEYAVKRWYNLDVAVEPVPFSGLDSPTHTIGGSGSLSGRDNNIVDSDYTYTGDAILTGDQLEFAIVQEISNSLGTAKIFTTGSFDLATGSGTQTVVDCTGDALICSDIENGSTALYVAQSLDTANPDAISWQIDVAVDLGTFGIADSASIFEAVRIDG